MRAPPASVVDSSSHESSMSGRGHESHGNPNHSNDTSHTVPTPSSTHGGNTEGGLDEHQVYIRVIDRADKEADMKARANGEEFLDQRDKSGKLRVTDVLEVEGQPLEPETFHHLPVDQTTSNDKTSKLEENRRSQEVATEEPKAVHRYERDVGDSECREKKSLNDNTINESDIDSSRQRESSIAGDSWAGIVPLESSFEPIESSDAAVKGYPKLDFKPLPLQTWFLALVTAFFSLCIGLIIGVVLWAHKHEGVIHVQTSSQHLAFRYIPVVLGSLSRTYWQTINTAYFRLSPYLLMSAPNDSRNRDKPHGRFRVWRPMIIPWQLDLNTLVFHRQWLLLAGWVMVYIGIFLISLKATLIQTFSDGRYYKVVISYKIAYILIAVYAMFIGVTVVLSLTLYNRETGLKWDPASVADQLALLQGSSVRRLFCGLETINGGYHKVLRERGSKYGTIRLGYWKRNGSIWHGIASTSATNLEHGRTGCEEERRIPLGVQDRTQAISLATSEVHTSLERTERVEDQRGRERTAYSAIEAPLTHKGEEVKNISYFRYRSVYWTLYDLPLAGYIILALIMLGLAITLVSNHGLENEVQLPVELTPWIPFGHRYLDLTDPFVFNLFPVFSMSLFIILWFEADLFFRNTQPFAGMGADVPASSNILLDYPTCMPVVVTMKALLKGHWRVALFSLLSLGSSIAPVVASGIFVGKTKSDGIMVHIIQPANYWTTVAILGIYLICIPLTRPTTAYRLPRCVSNIGDLALFCYQSKILDEKVFDTLIFSPQDAKDEKIHMDSRIILAKQSYQFGLYLGKDGRRHMGFDVAERQDLSGDVVCVDTIDPGRALYLWPSGWRHYFRAPRLQRLEV